MHIFSRKVSLVFSTFLTAWFLTAAIPAHAARRAAATASVSEVYGTASDGTPLHWDVYTPSTPGPWPVVLVIHGGGFISGSPTSSPESVDCARDLAAAGYLALSIEYRLAPPGILQGQVSDGRFPQQTNDVNLAVRTARSDPRCNGQVGAIGGSAGGYHTAFAATNGTPGQDRIDVGVCLSGAYDLSDFSPNPNLYNFTNFVTNYVGVTTSDSASLRAASPAWLVDPTTPPLYLVNTLEDPMPYSQLPDLIAKLDAAGVTNYQAQTLPGDQHSFAYWPTIKDHSLAFFAAVFAGTTPPPPSPPTPGPVATQQLLNVSTRAQVKTGDGVMIGGFIVSGDNAKRVVLRAMGPSLAHDGITGLLSDPLLQLFDSAGVLVESNDNSITSDNSASPLKPDNSTESLLTAILPPGNYTAIVSGVGSSQGIALFELYDLDPANSRVGNISTRGEAGTGTDIIIGGFIVGGTEATRTVVRALGPSLSSLGVSGALPDPRLELHDSDGTLLFSNDNWQSTQQQEISATGLAPSNPRESAILATLQPGNYTALVSGAGTTTGVALVEVYDLDNR